MLAVLICRVEPLAILKLVVAVAPLMLRVGVAPLDACKEISVLALTRNWAIVCVGTLIATEAPPWLNSRMSVAAGELRFGLQLVGVFQSAWPVVGNHVYVLAGFKRRV